MANIGNEPEVPVDDTDRTDELQEQQENMHEAWMQLQEFENTDPTFFQ